MQTLLGVILQQILTPSVCDNLIGSLPRLSFSFPTVRDSERKDREGRRFECRKGV